MNAFVRFLFNLNVIAWIIGIFIFHGLLYFFLGTEHWFVVTLSATAVWAVAVLILKGIGRAMTKEKEES